MQVMLRLGRRGRRVLPGLGRGHQTGIMGGGQMLGRTVGLPGPAGSGLPGRGRRGGGAGPDGAEFGCRETQASHGFLGAETGESGHPTRVCLEWTALRLGRCRGGVRKESPEQSPRDAPLSPPLPFRSWGSLAPPLPTCPLSGCGKWKLEALCSSSRPSPAQPHAASLHSCRVWAS